jgi:hypothetical protein
MREGEEEGKEGEGKEGGKEGGGTNVLGVLFGRQNAVEGGLGHSWLVVLH